MNAYIKVDNSDIVDIFFEYQKNKFDGSEIFFGDLPKKHKINGKSLSSEHGVFIFTWDGTSAIEKTQTIIDSDPDFIIYYKQLKKAELNTWIGLNTLDWLNFHTWSEVLTAWNSFKTNASSWTTKQDIDTAFNNAIVWLTT